MTRKHFEMIARALKLAQDEAPTPEGKAAVQNAAYCMVEELRATNVAFDKDRFLAACGALHFSGRAEPLLDRG